jgi:hypothetical protein
MDYKFGFKLYFMNQKLRSFLLHNGSSLLLLFLLLLGGCKKEEGRSRLYGSQSSGCGR